MKTKILILMVSLLPLGLMAQGNSQGNGNEAKKERITPGQLKKTTVSAINDKSERAEFWTAVMKRNLKLNKAQETSLKAKMVAKYDNLNVETISAIDMQVEPEPIRKRVHNIHNPKISAELTDAQKEKWALVEIQIQKARAEFTKIRAQERNKSIQSQQAYQDSIESLRLAERKKFDATLVGKREAVVEKAIAPIRENITKTMSEMDLILRDTITPEQKDEKMIAAQNRLDSLNTAERTTQFEASKKWTTETAKERQAHMDAWRNSLVTKNDINLAKSDAQLIAEKAEDGKKLRKRREKFIDDYLISKGF